MEYESPIFKCPIDLFRSKKEELIFLFRTAGVTYLNAVLTEDHTKVEWLLIEYPPELDLTLDDLALDQGMVELFGEPIPYSKLSGTNSRILSTYLNRNEVVYDDEKLHQ